MITKHKTDIKTGQKHWCNTVPLLETFSFPVVTYDCGTFVSYQ